MSFILFKKKKDDGLDAESFDRNQRLRSDDETYNTLMQHGADPSREHVIDFYFVGESDKLRGLESELVRQGYEKHPTQSGENTLLMQSKMKLELMHSRLITESLDRLAKSSGVNFDGWGTVAQK